MNSAASGPRPTIKVGIRLIPRRRTAIWPARNNMRVAPMLASTSRKSRRKMPREYENVRYCTPQRYNRRRFENAREIIHERKFAAHSIQIVVTIQQYPNGNDERQQHRVRSKLAAPAQRSGGAALYNRVVVTQIKRDEE